MMVFAYNPSILRLAFLCESDKNGLLYDLLEKVMAELYSYEKYRGYHLYVECIPQDEDVYLYEGVAQHNGTTIYTSKSLISGHSAECGLKDQIDNEV